MGTRQIFAEASDLFLPLDLGTGHHHSAHSPLVPENDHTSMESMTEDMQLAFLCASLRREWHHPLA